MSIESENKLRFSHRGKIDIIACILRNANESSRKIRLLIACNLSRAELDPFEKYLVEANLLASTLGGGVEMYETTNRGKEFLVDYHKIKGL